MDFQVFIAVDVVLVIACRFVLIDRPEVLYFAGLSP